MDNETTMVESPQVEAAPTAEDAMNSLIEEAVNDTISASSVNQDDAVIENAEPQTHTEDEQVEAQKRETNNEDSATQDFKVEQDLFERAIRAGMSANDVLAIPSFEMAERLVATAEKAAGISPKDNANDSHDAGEPVDELGAAIEEMEKDGGYDANILKLLKGLYTENKALKSSRETEAKQSFFDAQFGGLDDRVRCHVDAVRKSQLKSKFDMLEAGYKATNAKVSREEVFQEAAKLALGDLMSNAAEERKAEAVAQRKNLVLARPGGENGHRKAGGPATEEDIASELWEMFNN